MCFFPLEFQTESAIPATLSMRSSQKWTGWMHVDTWLCPNCETWEPFWVLQSHSMLHSPPDSMQTRWQMLFLSFMGKEYRCTSQREICLPSLHKAKPVGSQYITNSAWLFKLRSLTRIRLWFFFFFLGRFWDRFFLMYHFVAITLKYCFSTPKVSVFSYNKSKSAVLFYSFSVDPVLNELVLKRIYSTKLKQKTLSWQYLLEVRSVASGEEAQQKFCLFCSWTEEKGISLTRIVTHLLFEQKNLIIY